MCDYADGSMEETLLWLVIDTAPSQLDIFRS